MEDYFIPGSQYKFLHFFQHKSKYLHLIKLTDLLENKLSPFKIDLSINFKIPRWHRSIMTPSGDIYLTGGVSVDETEKKLRNCFFFDFGRYTLIPTAQMNFARSGHGICYLKDFIYVAGGFGENNEFTESCEKYSIQNNEWINIARLNLRANNACLCSFRDRFIYKFGGKSAENMLNKTIERYDPEV
jgi:hypothetical protein